MNQLNFKSNDEFYTPLETVKDFIKIFNISKGKVIWCPFDDNTSNFVIELKKQGYKVINSHINLGRNFYNYEPKEHSDIIISNPPFKNKRLIIERCLSFKKEFYLLLGSAITFQNGIADVLNKTNQYYLKKPVEFEGINNLKKVFMCISMKRINDGVKKWEKMKQNYKISL